MLCGVVLCGMVCCVVVSTVIWPVICQGGLLFEKSTTDLSQLSFNTGLLGSK